MRFYDLPWLHENTLEGAAFLSALCAPDFREHAALDSGAVAMIVARRWQAARPVWARCVASPFAVTLAVYCLWTLWVAPNRSSSGGENGVGAPFLPLSYVCCAIMLGYAVLACLI